MCAERLGQFVTLALVLATLEPARGTDATNPPEGPQDRGSQQKGRLSLQNTGKRVRPGGGGDAGTPGAVCAEPPGAHLGPRKLSRWRGLCKGKREARSAPGSERPESARANRVMKWLGQDLLVYSPGERK